MNNELERHKTSDKIKWFLTLLAFILVFVLLLGLIVGLFDKKEQLEQEETGETFVVTPQNSSKSMSLTATTFSQAESVIPYNNDRYTITANTSHYDGAINWSMAWTGTEVYWNSSDKTTTVTDCVQLTVVNSRTVRVNCLRPFRQQIKITATLEDLPSVSDYCICDYRQSYTLSEIQIGFNTFLPDGSLGKGLIVNNGIAAASVLLHDTQSLNYSCNLITTSYTKARSAINGYPDVNFTITPNYEVFEKYGLGEFFYMEYEGTFSDSLTGTIDDFFDAVWIENAVIGKAYSADDFAYMLINAENDLGFGIDSEAAYTLTVHGIDGECSYDYYFDLYDLSQKVGLLASVSLDKKEIEFGGG